MPASGSESSRKPGKIPPDLIQNRSRAMEALNSAGFKWPSDFSTIELVPASCGLLVCGLRERLDAVRVLAVLRAIFPDWNHFSLFQNDDGREPGWRVNIARDKEPTRS